jgi:hypothetical protein
MDKFPMMIFKSPGPELYEGRSFIFAIVENEAELVGARMKGWAETTSEAIAIADARAKVSEAVATDSLAPPTRAEIEQKSTELGISFTFANTDQELLDLIAAKIKAGA